MRIRYIPLLDYRLVWANLQKLDAEKYGVVIDLISFNGKVKGLDLDDETFLRICHIGLGLHEGADYGRNLVARRS